MICHEYVFIKCYATDIVNDIYFMEKYGMLL